MTMPSQQLWQQKRFMGPPNRKPVLLWFCHPVWLHRRRPLCPKLQSKQKRRQWQLLAWTAQHQKSHEEGQQRKHFPKRLQAKVQPMQKQPPQRPQSE